MNPKPSTLPDKYQHTIIRWYTCLFYVLALYKWTQGLWMYQVQPAFFITRPDAFTWLLMQTGTHQWPLYNHTAWIWMDAAFYSLPLIYWLTYRRNTTLAVIVAALMLLVNWIYVQCYTLYPTNSIEAHTAWLLFPLLFMMRTPASFQLTASGLRYFFLFFFASAGIWKLYQGSVFVATHMSGVLLYQHADLLHTSPGYWQAMFIQWLIDHQWVAFALYLLATIIELAFIIGFFTRKYDRLLVAAFIAFLLFDHLVMRIPYYEVAPFLLLLYFPVGKPAPTLRQ